MTDIRVDVSELEQFLGSLEDVERVVAPRVRRMMRISLDTIEAGVVARTPVNLGLLRGSIGTEIRGARLNLHGEVATANLYAEPVEKGRRAGRMPPIDAIELWVVRKRIAPPDQARGVAFLIARAIGAHGTQGAHMFEEGFRAAEPHVLNLWRGLPAEIVRELAR